MYILYKLFGKMSKTLSNALLIIAIPTSIIFCALGWGLFFIKDILRSLSSDGTLDAFDTVTNSGVSILDIFEIIRWVGFAIGLFFALAFIILIVAWITKKLLYKSVAGFQITRNKEWRNKDINKALEKLEDFRYRD